MTNAIKEVSIKEYPLLRRGKVRDIYDLGDSLLFVTTDRISAYDFVLPSLIPFKGKVLNQISLFWFAKMDYPNHILTYKFSEFPADLQIYKELEGRSIIVKKLKILPVEAIIRGYLMGSAWREYQKTGKIWDNDLPQGLNKGQKLPAPVFTPTTKADEGHDMPISFEEMESLIGKDLAKQVKDISLDIYLKGQEYAATRNIIIADTKMEFGILDGKLYLADELLTPDSSRFWDKKEYEEKDKLPDSMDKQIVRDYLDSTDWDKNSQPPALPEEIIEKVSQTYLNIYKQLTGREIDETY